jgi:hypothetical protein
VLIVAAACAGLAAAMPTFWTGSTQVDCLKGDVEDLSIDSDGRVFLGPSTSLVAETAAPFLWTVAAGADGTLWAGTGNEGKVLKVGKDGKMTTFFDAAELEARDRGGTAGGLYVATSPMARFTASPLMAARRPFRSRGQAHLVARPRSPGNLFAAQATRAPSTRSHPTDRALASTKRTQPTSSRSRLLVRGADCGTESPGRVFRIDTAGKAFVLLDSPFKEIHAARH